MKSKKPFHLLLRFSDNLYNINTILEHIGIINEYGSVWYGKVGVPFSKIKIEDMRKQIYDSLDTYLFLVQKKNKNYILYRANIIDFSRSFPTTEMKLIPNYYETHNLYGYISSWVKISDIVEMESNYLRSIQSISSVSDMLSTLNTSMAAMFYVRNIKNLIN